jgi:hypothetical protein
VEAGSVTSQIQRNRRPAFAQRPRAGHAPAAPAEPKHYPKRRPSTDSFDWRPEVEPVLGDWRNPDILKRLSPFFHRGNDR